MENSTAINIIKSRTFVATQGAYELQVTSVTPYDDKMIVNLKAMTSYHVNAAKEHLRNGDAQEAVNQSLSASLRMTDYIPAKGEFVKCQIAEITTKNDITGLFVVALSELKTIKSNKVSFDFEETETEVVKGLQPEGIPGQF